MQSSLHTLLPPGIAGVPMNVNIIKDLSFPYLHFPVTSLEDALQLSQLGPYHLCHRNVLFSETCNASFLPRNVVYTKCTLMWLIVKKF